MKRRQRTDQEVKLVGKGGGTCVYLDLDVEKVCLSYSLFIISLTSMLNVGEQEVDQERKQKEALHDLRITTHRQMDL